MTTSPPPQNFSMQPRGNGPALASLICSLVGFCVPVVGGLAGIILGMIGLGRAKETAKGGGMAIAGIIIGIITILGWSGFGYGTYKAAHAVAQYSKAPRDAARRYVIDLNKGDVDGAMSESSGLSKEEVTAQSAMLTPLGTFTDMTSASFNVENGVCTLVGVATFSGGTKSYTIVLAGSGTTWKVTAATFQ